VGIEYSKHRLIKSGGGEKMRTRCLECEAQFDVSNDVVVGELVACPDCGLSLEILRIGNGEVEVRAADVEGEDWGE